MGAQQKVKNDCTYDIDNILTSKEFITKTNRGKKNITQGTPIHQVGGGQFTSKVYIISMI